MRNEEIHTAHCKRVRPTLAVITVSYIFLLSFVFFSQNSMASVYKCQQSNGKTQYQATPCLAEQGQSKTIKQPNAVSASNTATTGDADKSTKKCTGKEMRIHFSNMPIQSALSVIADFSGNKLVPDASITGSGVFHYDCVAWDAVLQNIATKHNLSVKVESGSIFARKQ